jgi:impB/mucB/samB family C-terminal domain
MLMVLEQLAGQVAQRLAELEIAGKTVTLKLRWHNFQLVTRSMTVASPIQYAQAMMRYLVTQRLKRLGALVLQRRSLTHVQTSREGVGLAPVSDAP